MEDEAAWLRARVQAGELEKSKLELASWLGHPGTCSSATQSTPPSETLNWERWGERLAAFGWEVTVRAVVASASLGMPIWCQQVESGEVPTDLAPLPRAALMAAQVAVLRPSPASARQASAAGQACQPAWEFAHYHWGGRIHAEWTISAVMEAAELAADMRADLLEGYFAVCNGMRGSDKETLAAVRQELVPWALGYGDPVRDRVEARQRADAEPDS